MSLPYRATLAVSCLLFWNLPAMGQEGEKLEARLRELEKTIAAVRNLEFKEPVRARIIARPAATDKGVQGYYQPKEKTLYLFNDVAAHYEKGVLIHEMVHALQDQHFDLTKLKARLHSDSFGNDAELALAALIEGDATYTMIEVLRKEQPKAAAMLDMPLEKAKHLQNAFLYGQGARYVKMLKDKGGWANVNAAYKFPPRSTASIFNLQSVAAIDLGPGPSKGPFELWKMLANEEVTRPLAASLARAWRGDRYLILPEGEAWIIACATPTDGLRLLESFWQIHGQEDRGLKLTGQHQGAWRQKDGLAAAARDGRVILIKGFKTDETDYQAARTIFDRLQGTLRLEVYSSRDGKTIPWSDFIDRLLETDIICIGENHESDLHHRVQFQITKALFSRDERLAIGLEMFQKPFQKVLDRFGRGELSEEEFLKQSEYAARWGYDWSLYRPIIEFCRRNFLPMAALNAPRELTRRISAVGFAGLDAHEKKELGHIDFELKEHRAYWFDLLSQMHGDAKAAPERKERSYQVMAVWDDFMARTAAEFRLERKIRRLVILAGGGHVERGFGIPNRVARYGQCTVATVGIQVGDEKKKTGLTDYLVTVK